MPLLASVADAARDRDRGRMREILQKTVQEYRASEDINDLLWDNRKSSDITSTGESPDKVH